MLAFSEARGPNKTSAADSGNNHIVVRRSASGGETWGPIIHVAWNDWAEGCPHVHPASLCTFLSDPVPLYDAATIRNTTGPTSGFSLSSALPPHGGEYDAYLAAMRALAASKPGEAVTIFSTDPAFPAAVSLGCVGVVMFSEDDLSGCELDGVARTVAARPRYCAQSTPASGSATTWAIESGVYNAKRAVCHHSTFASTGVPERSP